MTMTDDEIGELLARVTAIDPHRQVGVTTVATWADIFEDVPAITFDQAYAALRACAKTMPAGFIGPNEIIAATGSNDARAVELDRLARAGNPPIPDGLTITEERDWRRKWLDAVKAGLSRDAAADAASIEMDLPPDPPALEAGDPRRVAAVEAFGSLLIRKTTRATDVVAAPPCDPAKRNRPTPDYGRAEDFSPVDHDYEQTGIEEGSLAQGGSYAILRCKACGRAAYSSMAD